MKKTFWIGLVLLVLLYAGIAGGAYADYPLQRFRTLWVETIAIVSGAMDVGGPLTAGSMASDAGVSGTTGTYTNRVTAAGLTSSEVITGTTGAFSGRVTAAGLTSSQVVTVNNNIVVTGSVASDAGVSGTTGTFSGRVTVAGLTSSGVVTVNNNIVVTGTSALDGNVTASGRLTVTTSLALAGEQFSGPVRYGLASSAGNGTLVAHGFSTTPTVVLLGISGAPAPLYTVSVSATNATSFTVAITPSATLNLFWMAGK